MSPPDARLPEIRNDYEKMRGMFFEQPATFEEMLAVLAEAERTINSLATP